MKNNLLILVFLISSIPTNALAEKPELQQDTISLDKQYLDKMMSRREVDDFTGEIRIDCPVLGNPMSTIYLLKTINTGKALYFMRLMTHGSTCVVDGKGVIILFTDGTKLTRSNLEIDVDVSDNGFQYTVLFSLTPDELKVLSSKTINKFRLYIFDGTVNVKNAEDFRIYSKNIPFTK